jgi:TetR/AcrR family transcriptional regulator, cholesterol catabolism regulator
MALARRGEKRAEEIRSAALELFYKRGFQASTLRGVAAKVGIQVGSLYNHIGSKSDLLFEIMEGVMLDLLADQREAAATPDVVERMRLLVEHHVMFHGRRSREVFVGNSELRSLSPIRRTRIIELRHEYEMVFRKELEDGIRQGKFLPVDVPITSYGILALATSVSTFYSLRGRLSLEQIAGIYSAMVLRGLWNPQAGALAGRFADGREAEMLALDKR